MTNIDITPDEITSAEDAAMTTARLEKEVPAEVTDGFDAVPRPDVVGQAIAERQRGFTGEQVAVPAGHVAINGALETPSQNG